MTDGGVVWRDIYDEYTWATSQATDEELQSVIGMKVYIICGNHIFSDTYIRGVERVTSKINRWFTDVRITDSKGCRVIWGREAFVYPDNAERVLSALQGRETDDMWGRDPNIDAMQWPTPLQNLLERELGCRVISDVAQLTREQVRATKGLGPAYRAKVKSGLKMWGFPTYAFEEDVKISDE